MADSGQTSWSEEEQAFLSRRVAFAALVAGGSFATFWLFRAFTGLLLADGLQFVEPSFWIHGATALLFFLIWALARFVPMSFGALRMMETAGFFVGSVLVSAMGYFIPLFARPDMIVLLAMTYALMARSIFVPSSGRRTLALSVVVGVVMLTGTYIQSATVDIARWRAFEPMLIPETPEAFALWGTVTQGVWWLLSTTIATASSYVIYGLRRQVHDAMHLGQYRLESKIGEGGMGEVYRAHHAFLRRPTAIKLLRPERAGAASIKRFETEVQLTAKLTHPNTVTVFDYGHTSDGVFYYAMELLDGADLDRIVAAGGPQDQARVRHLMLQVAAALVHAHGIGLIHRDIKPGNIMVTLPHRFGGANDLVKLLDFGLVKQIRAEGGVHLTQTNIISGTPQYMSPETILSPHDVDGRSDLYAVGAVAYYLLTGRPVFDSKSVVEVCSHHLHTIPDPISKHRTLPLSPDFEKVILDCLAKSPDDRPGSAYDLQRRLLACTDVGVWRPEDALGWWEAHDAALAAEASEAAEKPIAMTVDFLHSRR